MKLAFSFFSKGTAVEEAITNNKMYETSIFFLRNGSRGSHTCDLGVVPQPQDITLEVRTVFDHATARDRLVYEDGRRMKLHRQTCTVLHSHPHIVGNILLLAHRKYLYTHRHQNQGAYGGA